MSAALPQLTLFDLVEAPKPPADSVELRCTIPGCDGRWPGTERAVWICNRHTRFAGDYRDEYARRRRLCHAHETARPYRCAIANQRAALALRIEWRRAILTARSRVILLEVSPWYPDFNLPSVDDPAFDGVRSMMTEHRERVAALWPPLYRSITEIAAMRLRNAAKAIARLPFDADSREFLNAWIDRHPKANFYRVTRLIGYRSLERAA